MVLKPLAGLLYSNWNIVELVDEVPVPSEVGLKEDSARLEAIPTPIGKTPLKYQPRIDLDGVDRLLHQRPRTQLVQVARCCPEEIVVKRP